MPRLLNLTESQQQERYLRAIARLGTLTGGCRVGRCSPHTVYKWREVDVTFAAREHEAREAFADSLEEEAVRRARDRSDKLLEILLKAVRPEKYRERVDWHQSGGTEQVAGDQLTPEERERLRAWLTSARAVAAVGGHDGDGDSGTAA